MIVDRQCDVIMTPPARHPQHHHHHPPYVPSEEEPVSRTYQYRKVMKPMLERKRRARINRCLDELKELMVSALQAEGENVAKLEKADILELTVKHLRTLRRQGKLMGTSGDMSSHKFKDGFVQCASEVTSFVTGSSVESQAGARLLQHLNTCIRRLETNEDGPQVQGRRGYAPPSPPASPTSERHAPSMWRPW